MKPQQIFATCLLVLTTGMAQLNPIMAQATKKISPQGKHKQIVSKDSLPGKSSSDKTSNRYQPEAYEPVSVELYNIIAKLDSLYFETYNNCDLVKMRSMMADSIEFYHDRGGLITSIDDFMQAIKNNICGKVIRKAVPGSIEVYPIHDFGAVEIGYHRFFNKQEPENGFSKPDKYIVIWHYKNGDWKISRVVSIH